MTKGEKGDSLHVVNQKRRRSISMTKGRDEEEESAFVANATSSTDDQLTTASKNCPRAFDRDEEQSNKLLFQFRPH